MDEREGFISASKLQSAADCNGQYAAEAPIPEGPTSEAAERGNLIHSALYGETVVLNDDDLDLYYQLLRKRRAIAEQHFPEGFDEEIREERFYLEGDDRLNGNRFSGKPDFVGRSGSKFLVIDYKTGRGNVAESADNLQLRALAVLVAEKFEADVILVAIIQAYESPQVVAYTKNDLKDAREEVLNIIEAATDPEAARTPNEVSCKYCKARPTCPEALGTVNEVATIKLGQLIDPADLPRLLDACEVAAKVIADIKARATKSLQDGIQVEGWKLRNGNKTRLVADHAAFRKGLVDEGLLTPSDLAGLKISPTEAEKLIAKKQGITPKAARQIIDQALGDRIEEKQGAERLARA